MEFLRITLLFLRILGNHFALECFALKDTVAFAELSQVAVETYWKDVSIPGSSSSPFSFLAFMKK